MLSPRALATFRETHLSSADSIPHLTSAFTDSHRFEETGNLDGSKIEIHFAGALLIALFAPSARRRSGRWPDHPSRRRAHSFVSVAMSLRSAPAITVISRLQDL